MVLNIEQKNYVEMALEYRNYSQNVIKPFQTKRPFLFIFYVFKLLQTVLIRKRFAEFQRVSKHVALK